MNNRTRLFLTLTVAASSLFAVVAWASFQFAIPRSEWIEIGKVGDYPPADEPYQVFSPVYVFLVNDGQQILVIESLNPAPGGAQVRWISTEGVFIDQLRGTQFDEYEMPIRRIQNEIPMEAQSLERYPVKIESGVISFDRSTSKIIKVEKVNP